MAATLSHQDLSGLIGRIYDCTLDPELWEPVLDEMRSLLGCKMAQLGLLDLRHPRVVISKAVGCDEALLDVQRRHAAVVCAGIESILDDGLSMDEPLVVTRHCDAEQRTLQYFADCRRVAGTVDIAQINILRSPSRLAFWGGGRHESVGPFGEREVEILRLLVPHVRRAVIISDVLDAKTIKETRLSETLDALKLGVVLASENNRVVHANRAAEAMMRRDGPLRDVGGVLRAERPAASAELRAAVGMAARNESGIGKTGLAVRLSEDYENPIVAHVLPLANGNVRTRLEPEAVAAVFINSPLEEAHCARALTGAYKLTPAEARVLEPILSGRTVVETAADVGVAMTTARTHLNNIFAKTGVSRQSELIKLAAAVAPATL